MLDPVRVEQDDFWKEVSTFQSFRSSQLSIYKSEACTFHALETMAISSSIAHSALRVKSGVLIVIQGSGATKDV